MMRVAFLALLLAVGPCAGDATRRGLKSPIAVGTLGNDDVRVGRASEARCGNAVETTVRDGPHRPVLERGTQQLFYYEPTEGETLVVRRPDGDIYVSSSLYVRYRATDGRVVYSGPYKRLDLPPVPDR